ncbi:MAG: LapA family protein [Bacillota bacterium]
MKVQWNLILALIFALIVAIFAVVNVESVKVDYVFGTTYLPLILIVLGSALLGGLIVGSIGLFRNFMLQRQVKQLTKEKAQLEGKMEELEEKQSSSEKTGTGSDDDSNNQNQPEPS